MIWRTTKPVPRQSSHNFIVGFAPAVPVSRTGLLAAAGWFGAFMLLIGVARAYAASIPNDACGLAVLPVMFFVFSAITFLGAAVGKLAGRGWLGCIVALALVAFILVWPAISSHS